MTNTESAVYNRISTKCHLFVKEYYPSEYKKLVAAAESEYANRKYRQTSRFNLQQILNPVQNPEINLKNTTDGPDENYWNDPVFITTSSESEEIDDIL